MDCKKFSKVLGIRMNYVILKWRLGGGGKSSNTWVSFLLNFRFNIIFFLFLGYIFSFAFFFCNLLERKSYLFQGTSPCTVPRRHRIRAPGRVVIFIFPLCIWDIDAIGGGHDARGTKWPHCQIWLAHRQVLSGHFKGVQQLFVLSEYLFFSEIADDVVP